jgi:hypothetical protein
MSGRIAIMMPRDTAFYRQLAAQMGRGFQQAGWTVVTGHALLTGSDLARFFEAFRPDVLFEMNRPRREIPELPRHVRHVAWIVDTNGRSNDYFSGSEITYYWGANWLAGRSDSLGGFAAWLPPGTCPEDYSHGVSGQIRDFAYVGHMPRPWTMEEKDRVVAHGRRHVRFGDLLDELGRQLHSTDLSGFSNDDYLAMAESVIVSLGGEEIELDEPLRYDMGCRVVRQHTRHTLASLALASSSSVALYGSEGWLEWSEFKAFYQGFLTQADQLREVYQGSRINLHDGVGIHFRSMDCMGAGGLLFYLGSPDDDSFGGMHTFFEPERHFIRVDEESFADKARFYLGRPDLRRKISDNASQRVHAEHSWRHRALTVTKDLAAL